ncbi:MAG: nucleotidyltransferase domain-containing protein [Patescibacteria group bacterium]
MAKKTISKKITNMVMNYSDRLSKKESVSIKKMFIFGSVSKGKNTKNSDVDVCIVSPFFNNTIEAIQFLLKKRNKNEVILGLEPIGFSPKDFLESSSLIEEIKKTGIQMI